MLLQKHVLERITDRIRYEVQLLAQAIYEQPQENGHKAKISTLLEKLHLLPFRKMKFSSYVYYQQNDLELVRGLKAKFGDNVILIFGDWSAPNTKYQEPTRNMGLVRMLKKNGFIVYLTDECKTSTFCSTCESKLDKFKLVKNPRSYRRKENPTVMCHGLLGCSNKSCIQDQAGKSTQRVWNRDQAAVMNFLKILRSLRDTKKRPSLLTRKKQ
ncbi:hypothetical protein G6F56_006952 [Rhizopus delemar]|nr:hypothetical protein G6F56_006952 [Rhizopus delemar]